MTHAQDLSQPPSWLPLRVLCGSVLVSGGVLLMQKQAWQGWAALEAHATGLWPRCGASLVVLVTALLLALCLGLAGALVARGLGPKVEKVVAFFGRALACLPMAAVAWGFVGLWTGRFGLPVETLMPAELPPVQSVWQTALARGVWEFLAPALLLALPLTGEMLHAAVSDATAAVDLDLPLRARGVPRGVRVWRHHLRQMVALLRGRMQALCLIAPAYLIIVEDVLRFMGWGGWMAQVIRAADAPGIAVGFATGGLMMALLCWGLHLMRGRLRPASHRLTTLAWLPWPLWMLGVMTIPPFSASPCLGLWFAVLISGSAAWHDAWIRMEKELPLDAARVAGATEGGMWLTHIAPMQFRMLVAWISTAFAQTLLWVVMACALQPGLVQELEAPLSSWLSPLAVATPQDTARILADPTALLQAGGGIALAALCLLQVSRIVQPRSL